MTSKSVCKTVLPNGLRVVSESLPDRDSVTIGIWVEVGSRHEEARVEGVSHFLEHMVFKGTPTRTAREIASSIERLGGSLNAFTSREHTCFHARVLHRDLPTAVEVLADIATRALLPSAEVRKERRVVAEEIKDAYDTPHEWVHEVFSGQLWPGHPIGRPIAGSIATVMGMTRRHLAEHRQRFYRPDRIVVAAGGRLNHERLVRLVRKAFRFDKPSDTVPRADGPGGLAVGRAVSERDINQTHVCLGFPTWPFADGRRHTILLASNILGGGMSSRLFQTVREKRGLVYSIYAFQDAFHDSGFFGVYFACDPSRLVQACNLVLGQLGQLRQERVTAAELRDVKAQLCGHLLMGLESTPSRTHRIARHELYLGGYVTPQQTIRSIEKITARAVTEMADEAFDPDRLAIAILGPVDTEALAGVNSGMLTPRRRSARRRSRPAAR